MNHDSNDICYLCGNELGGESVNQDHIFQQQFVKRTQPKSKGFDYGGLLPVHSACNGRFGTGTEAPESICRKALQLLEVLHSGGTLVNPKAKVVAINSAALPEFTKEDVAYFKLIDAENIPVEELTSEKHLRDKTKVNPFAVPTNIALSTLAKSSAGFLVKRYSYPPKGRWRILAIPHIGQDADFDLDGLFGGAKPLEVGIKLWVKTEGAGFYLAYKHNRFLVFLVFESQATDLFRQAAAVFQNASCLYYDSQSLINLVGYEWSNNEYPL